MDPAAVARAYYAALDDGDYERLSSLLSPEFTQDRPDRRFEGRETFVRFMREDRPETDTEHVVHRVFELEESDGTRVAVEGTVNDPDGEAWFSFVDVFEVGGDRLSALRTYTR